MKFILTLLSVIIHLASFAQIPNKSEYPLDTVNHIVFGSYPEIHNSSYKGLPDTLLANFPNRNQIDFKNLSSTKRDSLVILYWRKFRANFNNSVDFNTLDISKKTKSFFFTLYFSSDGTIKYIFYNWNKYPDNNESFNNEFIQFSSEYDFKGFPKGIEWSQCGTFMYKNGKPKYR
jgi:hypothetical protein